MSVKQEPLPSEDPRIVPRARTFLHLGGTTGILLLHGFSGSIDVLRPLAAFLHGHGYTVLGARLAGHGSSEEELERSTRNDWRRSVAEAYERVRERCATVVVIGDSLGALLALDLAIGRQEIAGVVALNPAVQPRHAERNRWVLPVLRRFQRFRSKPWVSPEKRSEHLARGSHVRVPLRAYAEFLAMAREVRRILPRLSAPILVVQSTTDPTVSPKGARKVLARATSTVRAEYWLHDPVHHVVDSSDRAGVFAAILAFIRRTERLPSTASDGRV